MLRRIASHLFWTARNLERAGWRARLLDVNYHLLIESPPRDAQPWAPLLAIFGEREHAQPAAVFELARDGCGFIGGTIGGDHDLHAVDGVIQKE